MSKVFLSSGMGLLTYFVVHKEMYNYPAIIVAIGTYFIAETFFSVFSMAVDTYFLCACEFAYLSHQAKFLMDSF